MKDIFMLRIQSFLRGFTVLIFLWSTSAAAAYVCPNGPGPGEVMVGTQGGSGGIAVIPMCDSDGSANNEGDANDKEVLETRWGAVATGSTGFGAVTDMLSEKQAKEAAIKQCKKTETGNGSKCQVYSYYNQCIVVIIPGGFIQRGVDLNTAEKLGMQSCKREFDGCEIHFSGCSYGKWVK
jgi:hypothetical protein